MTRLALKFGGGGVDQEAAAKGLLNSGKGGYRFKSRLQKKGSEDILAVKKIARKEKGKEGRCVIDRSRSISTRRGTIENRPVSPGRSSHISGEEKKKTVPGGARFQGRRIGRENGGGAGTRV